MSHSRGSLVRSALMAAALVFVVLGVVSLFLDDGSPTRQDLEFYPWLALIAFVSSAATAWVLAHVRYFAFGLMAGATAGLVLAYAVGSITYGTEGELQNGLNFRAIGGGIVGVVSAIAAWALMRLANQPDRAQSPVADPAP